MNHRSALRHLKRADPVMAKLIERVGPCRFGPITDGTHFHHIARAIVFQQLSTGAARTIHGRFVELCGGPVVEPRAVLKQSEDRMRSAGLSKQKASYIRDLAAHVDSGALLLDDIHRQSDEAIIASLTKVKGIGPWSAQMFLMFRLGRPDVLPVLDLGIRKAVRQAYGLRKLPDEKKLRKIAAPWSPHSTVACWYLWRSLDGPAS
jgi:DNA-3-methyladenine glycosylase II